MGVSVCKDSRGPGVGVMSSTGADDDVYDSGVRTKSDRMIRIVGSKTNHIDTDNLYLYKKCFRLRPI